MRIAIIYRSRHNGNTKKLLDAICARHQVTLLNAQFITGADLSRYDAVGFATGIAMEKVYPQVLRAVNWVQERQKVFFLYTCGAPNERYIKPMVEAAEKKGAVVLGSYGCIGEYHFGPVRLKRGHPDVVEIMDAVRFFEKTVLGHS